MREVSVGEITKALEKLSVETNINISEDYEKCLLHALTQEENKRGAVVIEELLENAKIAASKRLPLCQDTGLAIVYLSIGQDVHLVGGEIYEAVDEGIRRGYMNNFLRSSVVSDPLFERKNSGDNTPAITHIKIVPGEKIGITLAPKGGGSENMSALSMLTPSIGEEGVKQFIIDTVLKAGANACPPMAVIGVGIGGSMEKAALLAKEALVRPMNSRNHDLRYAKIEDELLERINKSGIGPAGLGGKATALDVHIEWHPAHLASLPVAVNIQCNANRHGYVEI